MAGPSEVSYMKGSFAAIGDFEELQQEDLEEKDKES